MGQELDDFKSLLDKKGKREQSITIQWAQVTSVDWENKTCDADGVSDGLAFHDVLLGIGSYHVKPKKESLILVGVINNDETTTFLISAENIESIEIITNDCELTIDNGFLLKKENETLKKLMADLIQAIRNMVFQTNSGITIKLLTDLEFEAIDTRFKNFLK